MEENTSSGSGATPNPDPGVTPNATGSATGPGAALSHEDAMKRIAELERTHGNAKEELERHRKKLTGYEKKEAEELAARKAADEAQLSEIERIKKQHQEATQQIEHYKKQLIQSQVKLAAQAKGIIDPDLAALAIQSDLEYGEDGMPSNLDKALDTLIKNKPFLAPKPAEPTQAPTTPAQTVQTPRAPAVPAMNPGRSNIPTPGANPPGRIPRLSDTGVFVAPGTPSKYQP